MTLITLLLEQVSFYFDWELTYFDAVVILYRQMLLVNIGFVLFRSS